MPHLNRTFPDEKRGGKPTIDGGFGYLTNEARSKIKEINAVVHGWTIYSYGVTTTWGLTGEELISKTGVHRSAVLKALTHLNQLGWVVRAEWREGQKNRYGYLFLGHRVHRELSDDGETWVLESSPWNEEVVQEVVKCFPQASRVVVLGSTRDVRELLGDDPSEGASLSTLPGACSPEHPPTRTPSTYKTLGGHDAVAKTQSQSSASPPPRGDQPASDATPSAKERKVAQAALAHYNRQLSLATERDGVHRVRLMGPKQTSAVMAELITCIGRNSLVDVRNALDFAVFGDDHTPGIRFTGKGELVASWLHQFMADKPTNDHLDGDDLVLDVELREAGRLPSYEEVPAFRPIPARQAS